jgi:hypothetical protein
MAVGYYTSKYTQIATEAADSFGGFWDGTNKENDDPYDAYRHALYSAKAAQSNANDAPPFVRQHPICAPYRVSLNRPFIAGFGKAFIPLIGLVVKEA